MAYITPRADVVLCRGTGLSPDYNHTYRFSSVAEQVNFFTTTKAYKKFEDVTYVRDNKIRVEYEATYLYSCDYLCFNEQRNGATGTRWYYAFITDVRYINENTTEISYEIDEVQTWFFRLFMDSSAPPMYVLRQHSPDDVIYQNTQPEDVDLGGETQYDVYPSWINLAIKATYNESSGNANYTGVYGGWLPTISMPIKEDETNNVLYRSGIPSPIFTRSFKYELKNRDGTKENAFVSYLRDLDPALYPNIVDMFMYPEELVPTGPAQKTITEQAGLAGKAFNPWHLTGGNYVPTGDDVEYVPKNNKCYTYPYTYLVVTNGTGQTKEFRYEYFPRNQQYAIFDISGTYVPDPEFYCTARKYAEIVGTNSINTLTLKGVPKIPWVSDAYKVYMAQNAASVGVENAGMAVTAVQSLASLAFGGIGGLALSILGGSVKSALGSAGAAGQAANAGANAGSSAISGAFDIASTLAKRQDLKKAADNVTSGTAPQAMYVNGSFGFKAYCARIPGEYIRRIDRYFTTYGYATNRWLTPNIFSRQKWNYLRATGMCFSTFIPVAARTVITSVLANGITFWDKSQTIGAYSDSNPII